MPLSWNLGTLTSWNPLGHSRYVRDCFTINDSTSRKKQHLVWKQKAHCRVYTYSRTQRKMVVKFHAFLAWSADGRERSVLWLVNILGSFPLIVGANVLLIIKPSVNHKEHKVYPKLFSEISMSHTSTYTRSETTFWSHLTNLLPAWLHNVTTTETYEKKLIFVKTKLSNACKITWKSWIPVILLSERLFCSLKGMYYPTRFPY